MKLHFTVLDFNEHEPVFTKDSERDIYIKEDAPVGYVVVDLTATDADKYSKVSFQPK